MILKLEDKWRNTPALQEVRRDVLGLATRILESAASTMTALRSEIGWPAEDEELNWRSVGLAHQRIGEVRMAENQLAEADKEFRINNEICERVAAAHPENLEYQNRLLRSCRQLGVFAQHSLADSKEAMRQYQRALEIARKCVAKEPDNDDVQSRAGRHAGPDGARRVGGRPPRASPGAPGRGSGDPGVVLGRVEGGPAAPPRSGRPVRPVIRRMPPPGRPGRGAGLQRAERRADRVDPGGAAPEFRDPVQPGAVHATTPGCSCIRWATTRPAPASITARRSRS